MNFAHTVEYNEKDYCWSDNFLEKIPTFEQDASYDIGSTQVGTISIETFTDNIRTMQLEGNAQGIRDEKTQLLREQLTPITQEKLDIVNEFLADPLTQILDTIKNAKPDVAVKELGSLKLQLLWHFEKNNLKTMDEVKADMIAREGVDLLQVADACHQSRADYKENVIEQKSDVNKNTPSQVPHGQNAQNSARNAQKANDQVKPTYASSAAGENASRQTFQGPYSNLAAFGSKLLPNNNSNQKNSQNNPHDYNYAYAGTDSSATVINNNNDNGKMSMSASNVVINIANPIVRILGETIGLAAFNTKNDVNNFDKIPDNSLPKQINSVSKATPERIYYESRRKELLGLKQKFEAVQTGLQDACRYQNNNLLGLGHNYFKSINQSNVKSITQPTIDAESKLNETQKEQLRAIREADLQQIEQSIIDIQYNIVFLFKELIEQKNQAIKEYQNAVVNFTAHVNDYNNSLASNNKLNVDINIAIANYEKHHKAEALLDDIGERTQELSFVMQYYKIHIKTEVIDQTTNIAKVIDQETKDIKETETFIAKERNTIDANKNIMEQYLATKVNVVQLAKQYKEQAKQERFAKKANQNRKAQVNRANFASPKMPKKDDDKDKSTKDHPNGIYEDAAYHHKNSNGRKSPAPKDGQHALDNSLKVQSKTGETDQRIAISNDEFVILMEDSPGKFHGHVRQWKDLDVYQQNTLKKAGLVRQNGKIIK